MRDRIELLKRRFGSLKCVIGISHEDFAYYQELRQKAAWPGKPFHAHLPRKDMKLVAQVYVALAGASRDAVGNVLRPLRRRRSD